MFDRISKSITLSWEFSLAPDDKDLLREVKLGRTLAYSQILVFGLTYEKSCWDHRMRRGIRTDASALSMHRRDSPRHAFTRNRVDTVLR